MKTIAIIAKPHGEKVKQILLDIVTFLQEKGHEIMFDERAAYVLGLNEYASGDKIKELAELIIVLGGDGTLISAVRLLGRKETPILGINLGRVGFLAENRDDNAITTIDSILKGDFKSEKRMKLHCHVMDSGIKSMEVDVLNDVCINKSDLARIIDIEVLINDQFVHTYRADGLIFSTPTGSTAYNLAAGGPIVSPEVESIIITPICPHGLTNRPLLVSRESEISIRVLNEDEKVSITFDGQVSMTLDPRKKVKIKKAATSTYLIVPQDKNYYSLLREKLGWGER